ncbi:hypothetical protein [Streptomyces sp. HUAS TT7]|uniref:hypothetical protein n=1 Tax=Streptomyces sp. HUAS TT7 TaxID=3447507 RepID=UPI003F65C070
MEPLDTAAGQLLGAPSVSLAEYQALVNSRYQDKMPGTAYAAEGLGGGVPVAAPAADDATNSPLPLGLAAFTALATLATAWAATRRRTKTPPQT